MGERRGFTLVELMIVLAIIGIVAMIAVPNFRLLTESLRVEEETKRIYSNVLNARSRAAIARRVTFVSMGAARVRTFEDSSPAPDGNGALSVTADRTMSDDNVSHAVNTAGLGGAAQFQFDKDGVASVSGFFRLIPPSNVNPDYDCIRVEPTRIRLGKYDSATDSCLAK